MWNNRFKEERSMERGTDILSMYRIAGRVLTHAKYAASYAAFSFIEFSSCESRPPFSSRPVGLVGHVYSMRVCCLPNGSKRGWIDGGFHSLSREKKWSPKNVEYRWKFDTILWNLHMELEIKRRLHCYKVG